MYAATGDSFSCAALTEARLTLARRAVMDFWGRLHGFAQLGAPKRGWDSVGRYHPILRVTETGLRCAGPSFDEEPPA